MMKTLGVVVAIVTLGISVPEAQAQPGQTPQSAPPPSPHYGSPPQMTPEEYRLLQRGEIDPGLHVAGGLLGTFFGFGIGHGVQGRWSDKGWIFTVGEVASFGVMMATAIDCAEDSVHDDYSDQDCAEGWIVAGALGFAVFRIWEIVDVWAGPATHNARVRNLQQRYGPPPRRHGWSFYAAPPKRGEGAVAGLTLRF